MLGRRRFLELATSVVGALAALPASIARARSKKLALPLDKAEKLKQVGGSITLKIGKRKILFIRDGQASIRAVNPSCPHARCDVAYHSESNRIKCPCHRSAFDLDGKVLSGPSPAPLETYPARLDGDRIVFTVEE